MPTLSVLSIALTLGGLAVVPASAQAAPVTGSPEAASSPGPTGSASDAGVQRVGRDVARAAAAVELPRPLRGPRAVRALDDQLDEAAALNDLTEAGLTALLAEDPTAWIDQDGHVFYKDEPAIAPPNDPVSAQAPLDQTFLLHSKPGSTKTIYLDFDGGAASGTAWHNAYPATPTTQPAWDPSGNGAAFSDYELTSIQTTWQSVAEDYAPFDVDVTTADPGAGGIFRTSAADSSYGSHVLITPSDAAHDAICGGCGGVAYLNVFAAVNGGGGGPAGDGYGYRQPAWVFPQKLGNSPKNIAEAITHEVGHNLGLEHDGNATQGYDRGHGAWAPIMGVGYDHPVSQWSKGDYSGANNQQDDVAIIRTVTGSRSDEAPTSIAGAPAVPTGTAYVTSRSDVDTFLLGTCSGSVAIDARSLGAYADLDVELSLLDATGQPVVSDDPASAQSSPTTATGMDASISRTVTAGTYYASVDGVGNGPWSTGYDDYGSMGAYTLAATGCDGAAPTGTPSAPTGAAATPHATDPSVTLTWAAPSSAGSSAVTGYVVTRAGDDTPVQVDATATSYAWSGLASSTSYTFTITALNAKGPGPSATVTATTNAATVQPSAPQNVTGSWDSLNQRGLLGFAAPASAGTSAVSSYDIFIDGVYTYVVSAPATYIIPLQPGTHTMGVAAVNAQGRGPVSIVSAVVPAKAGNDSFAARSALSGVSGSTTGNNLESSAEAGEPAPPALRTGSGAASVWYSWTAPGSGPATLGTTSSVAGRDTILAVYTGTSVGALTQVAGNDDNGTNALSSVSFNAIAGTTYAVAVNGYRTTAAGVGAFGLTWSGTAPVAAPTTTTLGSVVTGRSATLTAGVTAASGTPAGTVEFRDNGVVVGTKPLASGSASITLTDLVKGDHPLRATFVPTDSTQFATSQSALVTSTVAATSSTTTLTATGGVQQVDLNAGVTVAAGAVAGTVRFTEGPTTVGTVAVTGGSASLSLTGVTAGSHTYAAVFVPADTTRYDGSTSSDRSVTVTDPVVARPTTTTLVTSASGRTATLTPTVTAASGTPQGTVQLRDGAVVIATVTLTGGTASYQATDLLRGTHRFTAEFVPTDSSAFVASQSAESVVEVAATPTTTSLTATSTPARVVTLQATVTAGVAGTVQFTEGATALGTVAVSGGSASLTVTGVPAGTHTWTATFTPADDTRWAPSSGQRVADIAATPTATALGSTVAFHRVTLVATVTSSGGSPAGVVEIREGTSLVATRPVSAGTATAVLEDVSTGGHDWTATFVPSSPTSYAGSTSSVHTATVQATPTTTPLVATASGRTVTLSAAASTVDGTLTGDVVFREGTTVVGTMAAGPASSVLTLGSVSPGAHSYSASFVPSGTSHAGSTSPTRSVTVQVGSTTSLTATATGQDVTLAVQVGTEAGSPAGSVELRESSALVGTVPLSGGTASLTLTSVTPGDHAYQATFVPADPSSYLGSASAVRTLTVDEPVVTPPPVTPPPVVTPPVVTPPVVTSPPTVTPTAPTTPTTPPLAASTTSVKAPRKARAGTRPTIAVRVIRGSAAATGKVTVTVGKKTTTLSLASGSASLKLPRVKKGKVTVTVRYLGDATTSGSSATRTIKVTA
ncbi:Ig-like domain repeat protein [Nocardioides KLBMP 9356]|uniref:Ig-like domain repeat protein n=1 Tax=Nocardioides potassii TaxID=2911371 RepID=A0ABS9H7Z8_9ACTN|nr:Ig-like domain repeat protein [Nocardioides potassii]MCF6376599.1 Ig-like domain repeat protein [Nocardioides potassii]